MRERKVSFSCLPILERSVLFGSGGVFLLLNVLIEAKSLGRRLLDRWLSCRVVSVVVGLPVLLELILGPIQIPRRIRHLTLRKCDSNPLSILDSSRGRAEWPQGRGMVCLSIK